jgi:demethoxyubiquinone hydroxylase (CLK1/Coq7/Cat5 family)
MDVQIKDINDLREEIARLRGVESQQGVALAARFNSPSALFSTIASLFSGKDDGTKHPGFFNQDLLGLLSRIVLPVTLNKTLFKHSNFLVKTLVGLISQKASNYISEDAVGSIWAKVKSLFNKADKKKPSANHGSLPHVPPPVVL